MIEKPEADELVRSGQIRVWAAFEILASQEQPAREILEKHINKLDEDPRVKLYKKQFSDIKRVEKPLPKFPVGFSNICETEFVVKNLDNIAQLVMEYGPSSVEILEPDKIVLPVNEAQSILNLLSEMMHKFAATGLGGIVVARGGK